MGFFKSLISDAVDSLKDQIVESVGEATNINLASLGKSGGSSSTKGELNHDKQIYGVRSLTVAFNGSKYAVSFKDDDEKHQTPYIYDNIMAMSQYHVATSQIQADGTVLYGVITGGWHFHDTGCEYTSVEFFDDDNKKDLAKFLGVDVKDLKEYELNEYVKITNPYGNKMIVKKTNIIDKNESSIFASSEEVIEGAEGEEFVENEEDGISAALEIDEAYEEAVKQVSENSTYVPIWYYPMVIQQEEIDEPTEA